MPWPMFRWLHGLQTCRPFKHSKRDPFGDREKLKE